MRVICSVAALVGLAPAVATAVTVEYTTSGTFSDDDNSPNLDFFGTFGGGDAPILDASFGTFKAYAGPSHDYTNQSFTLWIEQTMPGKGTGSVVGSLTGTLHEDSSGLTLDFGNNVATVVTPGFIVEYDPIDTMLISPFTESGGLTMLQGNVLGSITVRQAAAVPLPVAAWGGFALFGAMGIHWRRRQAREVL